jgi:hypothetical protein
VNLNGRCLARGGALFCEPLVMKPLARVCPSCGQPIIPPGLGLTPTQRRILGAVQQRPGISSEELRNLVWAHDVNGGPEDRKVIHVHVCHLNTRLAAFGVRVRGGSNGYHIVTAEDAP